MDSVKWRQVTASGASGGHAFAAAAGAAGARPMAGAARCHIGATGAAWAVATRLPSKGAHEPSPGSPFVLGLSLGRRRIHVIRG